jgi:phosphoserine phosphatase RsbU/P
MPKLIVRRGPSPGREYDLRQQVVLGRGTSADVSFDDPTISRRHTMLTPRGARWILTDLRSGNGTLVNGSVVQSEHELRDGDEVSLGNIALEFRCEQGRRPADSVVLVDAARGDVLGSFAAAGAVESIVARSGDARVLERRLQLVYDVGTAAADVLDERRLLELILEKLFEVFPQAERGFALVKERDSDELVPAASRDRSGETSGIAVSRSLVRDVVENRRGILSIDAMHDDRFASHATVHQLEIRSVVCVPMIAREELLGVLHVDGGSAAQPFSRDDMALMMGVAVQAALAISNARMHESIVKHQLLEQDLELAKKIQGRFLPRETPEVDGYSFRPEYVSALDVGGDYFDFIPLPGGSLGITAGDVSGKGVSAALYMAKLSSEMRYHSAAISSPGQILERVNRALMRDFEDGMFATLVFLALDPARRHVTLASAGHLDPLVRSAAGVVRKISLTRGAPLGVVDDAHFAEQSVDLAAGDVVVLYTDGVTEATNAKNELLGDDRLELLVARAGSTADEVCEAILSGVWRFLDGAVQNDDITIVCFGPDAR